ncbi:EAL domain-containing protein [Amycolatopsis sp. cmx-11-51]|uniref:EAL domain-containing protein n=1 Tax=Amycolatopsis sp. cmx-11-51 TaxID=2785797 RepID=UPI0039E62F06
MTDPASETSPASAAPAHREGSGDERLDRVLGLISAAAAKPVHTEGDEEWRTLTAAEVTAIDDPVTPGLRLTADDAVEFGRRWRQAMADKAFLTTHPRFADQNFGRWTASLLQHLGARVDRITELIKPELPILSPHQVGRALSYTHKLSADALGTCVSLLSDLATEFTPHAPRRIKAQVVGEFAGGFATGLRDRVREDQTLLSVSLARAHADYLEVAGAREFHVRVTEAGTAVLTLDPRSRILEANTAAQALLGCTGAQLRERPLADLADRDADIAALRGAVEQMATAPHSAVTRTEFQLVGDHYGPPRWISAVLGHADDAQRGLSVLLHDVTLVRALRHSDDLDPATGLLTAQAFADQAGELLDRRERGGTALLTVRVGAWRDLDHVLTQGMRDRLLSQIHAQIVAVADPDHPQLLAGHSHGDGDVLVLLSRLGDWSLVTRLVKQLADWMREPVRVGGHRLHLHPRIGIAEVREGDTLESALRRTRRALRDPDRSGEPWIHAEPADDADHHRALTMLAELDHAIDHTSLVLHYQPVRAADGTLAAIRPVASWTSPTGERHRLADVEELAERTGLLAAAQPLMLDLVCRDIYTWAGIGNPPQVMLDLPGRLVHDEALLDALTATTATAGLLPGQLQLAIPAASLVAAPPVLARLAELPHLGCSLALTGAYGDALPAAAITQLPWDTIGIDSTTLDHFTGFALLDSAIAAIHALGARALAEERPNPVAGFDLYQPALALTAAEIQSELGERS